LESDIHGKRSLDSKNNSEKHWAVLELRKIIELNLQRIGLAETGKSKDESLLTVVEFRVITNAIYAGS